MIAIIGGSGLDRFDELWVLERSCIKTSWGPTSGPLTRGTLNGVEVIFLPRHGDMHQLPPHRINYRANIAALKEFGVTRVIAVNAVGAIDQAIAVGDLVVPDQLIDYTWGRAHSFYDAEEAVLRHIDFTWPFTQSLRQQLLACAASCGLAVRDGATYAVTQGPRLETAAEIRKLAGDGCHLVGMTSMPEAALAREAGLAYASLALAVNSAAGMDDAPLALDAITTVIQARMPVIKQLLMDFCAGSVSA